MSNEEKINSYTLVETLASGIVDKKGYSDKKEILEEIEEFKKDNGIDKDDNFDIPNLSRLINQIGSSRIVKVALFDNLENGKCICCSRINFGLFPTHW